MVKSGRFFAFTSLMVIFFTLQSFGQTPSEDKLLEKLNSSDAKVAISSFLSKISKLGQEPYEKGPKKDAYRNAFKEANIQLSQDLKVIIPDLDENLLIFNPTKLQTNMKAIKKGDVSTLIRVSGKDIILLYERTGENEFIIRKSILKKRSEEQKTAQKEAQDQQPVSTPSTAETKPEKSPEKSDEHWTKGCTYYDGGTNPDGWPEGYLMGEYHPEDRGKDEAQRRPNPLLKTWECSEPPAFCFGYVKCAVEDNTNSMLIPVTCPAKKVGKKKISCKDVMVRSCVPAEPVTVKNDKNKIPKWVTGASITRPESGSKKSISFPNYASLTVPGCNKPVTTCWGWADQPGEGEETGRGILRCFAINEESCTAEACMKDIGTDASKSDIDFKNSKWADDQIGWGKDRGHKQGSPNGQRAL